MRIKSVFRDDENNPYNMQRKNMHFERLSLSIVTIGVCTGLLCSKVLASGYHFGSQSISAQGTAHANGAEANDPSTIFYNPAGLARLDKTQLAAGITLLFPSSQYADQGSTTYAKRPTGGGNGGTFAPSVAIAPSFYLASKINDVVSVGIGVFVPFGAKLDYGSSWSGRYALQSIDLKTININPSMSFKFNDQHLFGIGFSAQHMSADLEKAVDIKTGVLGRFSYALRAAQRGHTQPLAFLGNLYGYTPAQLASQQGQAAVLQRLNALGDGRAKMSANDWGFGFNVGYLYQFNPDTRFGLAYRSFIAQKLQGSAEWDYSQVGNSVIANIARNGILGKPGHDNSHVSANVDTPESCSASAFHQLNDKVAIMGDITWTRHSRLKRIDIRFDDTRSGDLVIMQNWRNTYKASLGSNYQYNDRLMLRGGIAYDQSPVPNDTMRHPALPDSSRYGLSLGANYHIDKKQSLDFAYSYVFFKNASVNYSDSCYPGGITCTGNGETTVGNYKTYMQFAGLQYNYRY